MTTQPVVTVNAPTAIGPYSQAIHAGDFVFCSGQLGLDPATAELVSGGIEAETRQALENLAAVLEAAGTSLQQVTKTTVFLTDLSAFEAMNRVYGSFFTKHPPARSTVQVAALPRRAFVEIEATAIR